MLDKSLKDCSAGCVHKSHNEHTWNIEFAALGFYNSSLKCLKVFMPFSLWLTEADWMQSTKSIHSCCVSTDSVLPANRPDVQRFFPRTMFDQNINWLLKSNLKCAQHDQPVCKNAGFTSSLLQTLMLSDNNNIIVAKSGPDVVFLPWCWICNSTYCPSISQVHLVLYL